LRARRGRYNEESVRSDTVSTRGISACGEPLKRRTAVRRQQAASAVRSALRAPAPRRAVGDGVPERAAGRLGGEQTSMGGRAAGGAK